MKKILQLFALILLIKGQVFAQKRIPDLFSDSQTTNVARLDANTLAFVGKLPSAKILTINSENVNLLFMSKEAYQIAIPTKDMGEIELILTPATITAPNFKVKTLQGDTPIALPTFYWGKVKGFEKSFVSLTVTATGIEGMIVTDNFNFTIGKIKDNKENLHIIYATKDIPNDTPIETDEPIEYKPSLDGSNENSPIKSDKDEIVDAVTGCRAIRIYMEADYQTYQDLGNSVTNVTNYVTTMFNNVAQLYANEGVNLVLSSIFVWTTTDPYVGASSTSAALYLFDNISFTGDIAHLVSTRSLGGGIAYIGGGTSVYGGMTSRAVFQSCSHASAFGLSASLSTTVVNIPTYSWNIGVIAHELGHNFGLPHTHSCNWPGGAIDNCGPSAGYTEGTCPPPTIPANTGTIMSYCHLSSTGINFLYGFGQMPGDKMRAEVAAATCLGGSVAPIPTAPPVARCGTGTVILTASGCSGTYRWYNAASGGTLLGSSASYTTASISTTTNYYVDCTIATNCTSKRAVVQAIVGGGTPPTTTGGSGCGTNVTVTLSAAGCNGGTYLWYNTLTGGSSIGAGVTFITPPISVTTTYYVSCNINSCSPTTRTAAVATITAICPYCIPPIQDCSYNDFISNVKISQGTNILLNKTSDCGANGYSYTTNPVPNLDKSTTYTISLSNPNVYSEGAVVWIDYNKNGIFDSSEIIFTKTSARWSEADGTFTIPATAINGQTRMRIRLAFSTTPLDPCAGSTYGETEDFLVNITGGCSVAIPTATNVARCGVGTVTLVASGCNGTYKWYEVASGGSVLSSSTSYIIANLTATKNYYVDCTVGTCISSRRTVTATINPLPSFPTVSPLTVAYNSFAELSASNCNGSVKWYSAASGGTLLFTGIPYQTPNLIASITYFASCASNTCESGRSPLLVTVLPTCNQPDLIVSNILPTKYASDKIYYQVIVKNQGEGIASLGSFSFSTYGSSVATYDNTSVLKHILFMGGGSLAKNQTITYNVSTSMNYNVNQHYLIVGADHYGLIEECNENNNLTSKLVKPCISNENITLSGLQASGFIGSNGIITFNSDARLSPNTVVAGRSILGLPNLQLAENNITVLKGTCMGSVIMVNNQEGTKNELVTPILSIEKSKKSLVEFSDELSFNGDLEYSLTKTTALSCGIWDMEARSKIKDLFVNHQVNSGNHSLNLRNMGLVSGKGYVVHFETGEGLFAKVVQW